MNRDANYWQELVYYDGEPRTRAYVQDVLLSAGVPEAAVAAFQETAQFCCDGKIKHETSPKQAYELTPQEFAKQEFPPRNDDLSYLITEAVQAQLLAKALPGASKVEVYVQGNPPLDIDVFVRVPCEARQHSDTALSDPAWQDFLKQQYGFSPDVHVNVSDTPPIRNIRTTDLHRRVVKQALDSGLRVPAHVIAFYPEFMSQWRGNFDNSPEATFTDEWVDFTEGPHSYASTQFNFPADIAKKIQAVTEELPDGAVIEKESNTHLTVLYGIF